MYTTNKEQIISNIVNALNQKSNVSYVSIPFSSIEDFEISEEEIQEYYNNNIEDFQNEKETRNIEYVTFTSSSFI